jgi:hypothetical protein
MEGNHENAADEQLTGRKRQREEAHAHGDAEVDYSDNEGDVAEPTTAEDSAKEATPSEGGSAQPAKTRRQIKQEEFRARIAAKKAERAAAKAARIAAGEPEPEGATDERTGAAPTSDAELAAPSGKRRRVDSRAGGRVLYTDAPEGTQTVSLRVNHLQRPFSNAALLAFLSEHAPIAPIDVEALASSNVKREEDKSKAAAAQADATAAAAEAAAAAAPSADADADADAKAASEQVTTAETAAATSHDGSVTLEASASSSVGPMTAESLSLVGGVQLWLSPIKSHAYVTYASVEDAAKVKAAIEGKTWPEVGGKALVVRFTTMTAQETAVAIAGGSLEAGTPAAAEYLASLKKERQQQQPPQQQRKEKKGGKGAQGGKKGDDAEPLIIVRGLGGSDRDRDREQPKGKGKGKGKGKQQEGDAWNAASRNADREPISTSERRAQRESQRGSNRGGGGGGGGSGGARGRGSTRGGRGNDAGARGEFLLHISLMTP